MKVHGEVTEIRPGDRRTGSINVFRTQQMFSSVNVRRHKYPNYISELRMANKNILSQYNFSRLLAVKIIFTWFSPIIRDQGCVKAEKAFYYIMY